MNRRLERNTWQGNDYAPLLKMLDEGYAVEVAPAAHYFEGGIHIDANCAATIPGLFAAGECAAGVFGANRVSAATTEMVIEGHLAGASAARFVKDHPVPVSSDPDARIGFERVERLLDRPKGIRPTELKERLQQLAWNNLWVLRDGKRMEGILPEIESIKSGLEELFVPGRDHLVFNKEWITALELQNLTSLLEVVTKAALYRTESRGVHFRTDFPETDFDNWNRNILVRDVHGTPDLRTTEASIGCVEVPKGKVDYLESIRMAVKALETF
jgi:succinate dehydrogenase/fumarate reductase flavoprotein subunit